MADRVPQVGVCENGYRHEPLAGGRPNELEGRTIRRQHPTIRRGRTDRVGCLVVEPGCNGAAVACHHRGERCTAGLVDHARGEVDDLAHQPFDVHRIPQFRWWKVYSRALFGPGRSRARPQGSGRAGREAVANYRAVTTFISSA